MGAIGSLIKSLTSTVTDLCLARLPTAGLFPRSPRAAQTGRVPVPVNTKSRWICVFNKKVLYGYPQHFCSCIPSELRLPTYSLHVPTHTTLLHTTLWGNSGFVISLRAQPGPRCAVYFQINVSPSWQLPVPKLVLPHLEIPTK